MTAEEYEVHQNEMWETTTQNLPLKMRGRIDEKVNNHLKFDPENSESLKLELKGLRSFRFKSGDRIIFAICEECRKFGFTKVNECLDCTEIKDKSVMLFAFGPHKIYNWLSKKRRKRLKRRGY